MTLIPSLLAAAGAAAASPLLLRFARSRSLQQPLPHHVEEERRVLDAVRRNPGWFVYIHQLEPEHFVDETLANAWRKVVLANAHLEIPETPANEKDAYRVLEAITDKASADLEFLPAYEVKRIAKREDLLEAATKIYSAGMDRTELAGSSNVERTGDPAAPLRRILAPTGVGRWVVTLVTAVAGAISSVLVGAELASPLATAALLILTVGSVIWMLVDLDTMYIDLPTFWGLGGAAWIVTLLAGFEAGRPGGAVTGLLVSGAVVLFIEIVNQVYKRVRRQHGMGTGDYLLILATIGVPSALTGSWMLGQWILIASLSLGVLGWLVKRLTVKGFGRDSAYAFGPYLATGWILGLLGWVVR